jgi:hypothetical protein
MMKRRNKLPALERLPIPLPRFDISKISSDDDSAAQFESIAQAISENATRTGLLQSSPRSTAKRLASRLAATTALAEESWASAIYVREVRRRLVGYSLRQTEGQDAYHTTLVGPSGTIPVEELNSERVQRFSEAFRKQLIRAGCDKAGGFISAWLHGNYNPVLKQFQLHWHLIHTAQHKPLLEELSRTRAYRPSEHITVPRRTVLIKDDWVQHSYAHQGFWYCKVRVPGKSNNLLHGRYRIPGEAHTTYLLTIDSLRFSDVYISYPPILKK